MPTNTYVALRTETIAVATPSVTFNLTGITGYTDLVIVATPQASVSTNLQMRFNGSSSAYYSNTGMRGYSTSTADSFRQTNLTSMTLCTVEDIGNPNTNFIIQIQNYSNTTTFKTALVRANQATAGTETIVGLWRGTTGSDTPAITSITLLTASGNLNVGSTFTIYGIANADNFAKATGGMISEDANYWYHTFAANGTFTPKQALTCDYLVVAGGGGGSGFYGGGAGAGGLRSTVTATGGGGSLESPISLASGTNYAVTVGAGGAGGANSTGPAGNATSGTNSVFSTITSIGGGYSGNAASAGNGATGGSGSGAGGGIGGIVAGNAGTVNQGFAGATTTINNGGGGGGAGAAGSGRVGGNGVATSISGSSVTYAGGGGASTDLGGTVAAGGTGGGGASASTTVNAVAGTINLGGGGGGGNNGAGVGAGGNGGSGIVIVRYAK